MIATLLVALQVAVASPTVLIVRHGDREAVVPLVATNLGPALRPELLAPVLDASVTALASGRHAVTVAGVRIELIEQVPFAIIGASVLPIAASPYLHDGALHVPLQVIAELLPRYVSGLIYDPSRSELRKFVPRVADQPLSGTRPPAADAPSRTRTAAGVAVPAVPPGGRPGSPARATRKSRLVIVDAGHGGPDGGMHGPIGARRQVHEKDIALAVARRLREALEKSGVRVAMTRSTDTLIALSDRGSIANQLRGDLFISIHVNAANMRWRSPQQARGFETYFLAEAKTEDARRVEQMENAAVRFETNSEAKSGDPLSFIINDMAQNEHLRESSDLAETVQRHLARMHPGPNRGVKQAGFRVLVTAYMPAILVEIGFGTNAEEAAYLENPVRQGEIAEAVAAATLEYFEHFDRRIGTASR